MHIEVKGLGRCTTTAETMELDLDLLDPALQASLQHFSYELC